MHVHDDHAHFNMLSDSVPHPCNCANGWRWHVRSACGFGVMTSDGFFCSRARRKVALAMEHCLSHFKEAQRKHTFFEAVLSSLWAECVLPAEMYEMGLGDQPKHEAQRFWSALDISLREPFANLVQQAHDARTADTSFINKLDELCAQMCVPENEYVCRRVGAVLEHVPRTDRDWRNHSPKSVQHTDSGAQMHEFLQSPCVRNAAERVLTIKGDNAGTRIQVKRVYETKCAALFDPKPCFNRLRRVFFCPAKIAV